MTANKTPDKSQETYPGPRNPEKEPDFVKDWEAEPTRLSEADKIDKEKAARKLKEV